MLPIMLDALQVPKAEVPDSRPQNDDSDFPELLFSVMDQSSAAPVRSDTPRGFPGLERLLSVLARESGGEVSELENQYVEPDGQPDAGEDAAAPSVGPTGSGQESEWTLEGEVADQLSPDTSSGHSEAEASIGYSEVAAPASEVAAPASDVSARSVKLAASSSHAPPRSIAPLNGTVDHSMEGLHPTLREKVERVIERMRSEHGHDVELVEGYRTAERQDYLYAQGRTRSGPVVTWTRDSRHTQRQAADLMVDGGWSDPSAYERLDKIAQSEGLRTLGEKDPGHVELAPQPGSGGVARVARVARVAQVARPVAARPGVAPFVAPRPSQQDSTILASRTAGAPDHSASEPAGTVRSDSRSTSGAHDSSDQPSSTSGDQDRSAPSVRRAEAHTAVGRVESSDARPVESSESPGFSTEVRSSLARGGPTPASPVTERPAVNSMFQVERVLEAQDAQRALTPQRVAVRLNGLELPVEAIRVGLLDGIVDADIELMGRVGSRQLRTHVADLFRALDGHGLELGSLGVDAGLGRADLMGDAWMSLRSDPTSEVLKALLGGDRSGWLQDGDTRDGSHPRSQRRSDDANPEQSRNQKKREEESR